MTKKTPLIIWEKWMDPFGEDIEEAKWVDYENNIDDINSIHDSPDNVDEIEDEIFEEDEQDNHFKYRRLSKPIKVIASPLGLIPYNEHTASGKIFNFWVGHTNFSITEDVKKIIENCDGVEILDIFTRYRFRIGIGKCFNESDTMKLINDNIYQIQ
jgi:hypothetical protein